MKQKDAVKMLILFRSKLVDDKYIKNFLLIKDKK